MHWIPIIDNIGEQDQSHWLIDLDTVEAGNVSFQSVSGRAIIDTGTSFIRVPNEDFAKIKEVLEEGRICTANNGHFSCKCGFTESYSNFPTIQLQI